MTDDDIKLALTHAYEDTDRLAQSWLDFAKRLPTSHPLVPLATKAAASTFETLRALQTYPGIKEALQGQ